MNKLAALGAALAVSSLAMSMGAEAATYNFDVVQSVDITPGSFPVTGSGSGTGTATWDDVAGTVTMDLIGDSYPSIGGATHTESTVYLVGNAGSPFAPTLTGSTSTVISCSPSGLACSQTNPGTATPFTSVGGSLTATGGTLTSAGVQGGGAAHVASTYTLSVSAVPIPAAAWLFGSGLIGLAGIARRRRS